jgi:hypothetical protein
VLGEALGDDAGVARTRRTLRLEAVAHDLLQALGRFAGGEPL